MKKNKKNQKSKRATRLKSFLIINYVQDYPKYSYSNTHTHITNTGIKKEFIVYIFF